MLFKIGEFILTDKYFLKKKIVLVNTISWIPEFLFPFQRTLSEIYKNLKENKSITYWMMKKTIGNNQKINEEY
jgi:hypothetical protein